jgi:hypothetical protein
MSTNAPRHRQTIDEKIDELLDEAGTPPILKGKTEAEIRAMFELYKYQPADGDVKVEPAALLRTADNKIIQVETGNGLYEITPIMKDALRPTHDEIVRLKEMVGRLKKEYEEKPDDLKASETALLLPTGEEYIESTIVINGRKYANKIVQLLMGGKS